MRKATAAVSVLLLVLVSVAVAEAGLLAVLLMVSSILRLYLTVELGGQVMQVLAPLHVPATSVVVHQAGTLGSVLVTLSCGVGAATWRFRRWRPA